MTYLVYRHVDTKEEIRLSRDKSRKYFKEDGSEVSKYQLHTKYNFIRDERSRLKWETNANGFKVRVKMKKP